MAPRPIRDCSCAGSGSRFGEHGGIDREAAVTKPDACPSDLSRAFAVRSGVITRAGRSLL